MNHRKIRLRYESLAEYDTTINCDLPMPKYIFDDSNSTGKLFVKNKTIFESESPSVTCYSEAPIIALSNVELGGFVEVR